MMRTNAEIEAKVVEHKHVVAREMVCGDVGVAVNVVDLDQTPGRITGNKLRVLRRVK